jgi:SAM-dependent methyltransferase
MIQALRSRIARRHQLDADFTLRDLRAAKRTLPVPIETFEVSRENPLQPPSPLADLAISEEGEPFLKWWQYFEAYDAELADLARRSRENVLDAPLRILEIGVWRGGSLGLWRRYFGDSAVIFGIDIDASSATYSGKDAEIRIGSQTDEAFMSRVVDEMGGLDVVIDDGSHISSDVIATLRFLWDFLAEGGVYFIEDLHTSYWPAWGGGLRRQESSIEALKRLVDVLHQPYFRALADPDGLGISRDTLSSVTFYDSVAVLHKRRMPAPVPFRGGIDR